MVGGNGGEKRKIKDYILCKYVHQNRRATKFILAHKAEIIFFLKDFRAQANSVSSAHRQFNTSKLLRKKKIQRNR